MKLVSILLAITCLMACKTKQPRQLSFQEQENETILAGFINQELRSMEKE